MDSNNLNQMQQGQPVPPQGQPIPPQGQPVPPQGQYVQQVQVPPSPQYVQPGQPIPPNAQFIQPGQPVPPQGQPVPPNAQYVQYQQVPPNVQYVQPGQPAQNPNKKVELLLCILSVCLHFASPAILGSIAYLFEDLSISSDFDSVVPSILYSFSSIGYIASWVLMIIARVKFKKSVFAKVLMWVYIGILILSVVVLAIIIISCYNALKDCPG